MSIGCVRGARHGREGDDMEAGAETTAGRRVLVVYATKHGSTAKVAETVAEELRAAGCVAEVRTVGDAGTTAGFDAVVVGGPMILGWHKDAVKWVKARRDALAAVPVAYFLTAASLTEDGLDTVDGVPVFKDPWLAKKPTDPAKLSYRQRYALPSHYLGDVLKETAPVRPRRAGFFAGALDLTTMNIFEKLFVMLVIGATPGDGRHWDAVRGWARGLPAALFGAPESPAG
jgi:menaquinone-dependent protoporphyrinogen oxidase